MDVRASEGPGGSRGTRLLVAVWSVVFVLFLGAVARLVLPAWPAYATWFGHAGRVVLPGIALVAVVGVGLWRASRRVAAEEEVPSLDVEAVAMEDATPALGLAEASAASLALVFEDAEAFVAALGRRMGRVGAIVPRVGVVRVRRETGDGAWDLLTEGPVVPELAWWCEDHAVVAVPAHRVLTLTGWLAAFPDVRVGVAVQGLDGTDAATLVERAGAAAAAAPGPAIVFHGATTRARLEEARALVDDVRVALHAGQIRPWFQPIHGPGDRAIVGAEALVRWIHPDRGLLTPASFLPDAIERGVFLDLGAEVTRRAMHASERWCHAQDAAFVLAINATGGQLRDRWAMRELCEQLRGSALPWASLRLEVPHQDLRLVRGGVARLVAQLRALGVDVVVDGFTGDPAALADVGVSGVKVDVRPFLAPLPRWPELRALGASVRRHGLGLHLGFVEQDAWVAPLMELPGVRTLQGFALSSPVDDLEFDRLLIPATFDRATLPA